MTDQAGPERWSTAAWRASAIAWIDAAAEDLGSRAELVETAEIACRVGKIARALVWQRALSLQPQDDANEFADAPIFWVAEMLQPSWLGSSVQL